jgi:hypothetical protein
MRAVVAAQLTVQTDLTPEAMLTKLHALINELLLRRIAVTDKELNLLIKGSKDLM